MECEGWVKVEGCGRLDNEMFVVRASGKSMEPKIHDGDLCVMRARPQGSRVGMIVLAQHRETSEPETGCVDESAFVSRQDGGFPSYLHELIDTFPSNPCHRNTANRMKTELATFLSTDRIFPALRA